MSAPYLSQLRSGNRTNPSSATMAALANFFRIKPAYFTDDEYYEKLDKELSWLASDARRRCAPHRAGHRRVVRRRPSRTSWSGSTSCAAPSTSTPRGRVSAHTGRTARPERLPSAYPD